MWMRAGALPSGNPVRLQCDHGIGRIRGMAVIEAQGRLASGKQAPACRAFVALAFASVAVLPSAWASDAPAVRFTPPDHNFLTHDIGTTDSTSFVLENQSKSKIKLQFISIKGVNPDFFIVQNDCPRTLAATKKCTVVVGFSPTTDRRTDPKDALE